MEGLFNPVTILLHTLNALILLTAIYFLLYKPVRKFLMAREEKINAQFAQAEKAANDAQQMRAQVEKQQKDAEHTVAETLTEGQQRMKIQQDQMLESARQESKRIIAEAQNEARVILNNAHDAMKAQAAELAVDIAKALLAREIKPEDNRQLIADFLEKVG